MTLFDLLILLIVAGLCGALGQAITGFSRGGCLVSIALGFVGAVVGMWLARTMGLPELFAVRIGTTNFPIVLVNHRLRAVRGDHCATTRNRLTERATQPGHYQQNQKVK